MTLKQRLWRWVFHSYKPCIHSLGFSRLLFASGILLLGLPRHLWIAKFSDSFFVPPIGITLFFRGFPPASFFYALNFLLIWVTLCVLIGYKTRAASVTLAILFVVGNAWDYSFGKISHDILLVVVPAVMAFSDWGQTLSADAWQAGQKRRTLRAWPVTLLALVVSLLMFTAAWPKLVTGWLDPHSQAVRGHLAFNHFVIGRHTLLSGYVLGLNQPFAWEMLDIATVALEAGFLVACLSCRAMRVFCAGACFLHAGIFFLMNIFFWPNLVAYAMLVDWSWAQDAHPMQRFWAAWERLVARLRLPSLLLASASLFCVYVSVGNPFVALLSLLFADGEKALNGLVAVLAVMVASLFLIRDAKRVSSCIWRQQPRHSIDTQN